MQALRATVQRRSRWEERKRFYSTPNIPSTRVQVQMKVKIRATTKILQLRSMEDFVMTGVL